MSIPAKYTDVLVGEKLSANVGYGALVKQFLRTLVSDSADFSRSDGDHLSVVMCDLVSGLFAKSVEVEGRLPVETRKRTLLLEIKRFIGFRICDPGLTLQEVADAHHISVSYLHRIFGAEEMTVSSWILRKRLENAYGDLVDPGLSAVPVFQIAEKWGFKSAAVFSRSFRDFYGVSPKEVRS
ncbi:hypothetical protein Nans01_14360 [Nocardiopsis ansamitocini]|uniref:HTH araC/xylS-type domain-containing protein n=1 Tax=Nocardiopsis ansamitocini TaxID=1670832 RepID=A0A9W6P4J5_9ACTN|nr:hypothetical protein Nans01_14360 [Nocardiopsis ansamitocini]